MSRHRFLKYATTELKKKVLVGGMKVYSYTIELGIIEQLITVVLVILWDEKVVNTRITNIY